MPGMGRTKYWWNKYHEEIALGHNEDYAAEVASIIEKRHRAKAKRQRRRSK